MRHALRIQGAQPRLEHAGNAFHVVDAAAPDAAAGLLERRPQASIVGEAGVGREFRVGRTAGRGLAWW